jgi:cold shock protein
MTSEKDVQPEVAQEQKSSNGVVYGTVKWFNEQKGFGFIEQANGRDLFVHYKEIRGKLKQGDKVEYILGQGERGPCATKVKVVADSNRG